MVAEYNSYCAICSGSFANEEIGCDSPRELTIRRSRVARRKYWAERDCGYDETDDEDEEGREERKRYMASVLPPDHELLDDTDDASSVSSYDYDHSYDPGVVTEEDVAWRWTPFGVGIDHRREGERRYFISEFRYEDRNWLYMVNEEEDPELPEHDSRFFCYFVSDLDDPPVYPFHWDCLALLTQAIGEDGVDIRKDVLYNVMHELGGFVKLDLDYGKMTGADQDWQCVPGEEYSVMCPTASIQLEEYVPDELKREHSRSMKLPDLSRKVISDPFSALPSEVTDIILSYLPIKSVQEFSQACWTVYTHTCHQSFWKRRIDQDLPWFWELHELTEKLEEDEGERPDYRGLYLWLDQETTERYGMTGPFLSVANRRRIWGPCTVLARHYHERLLQAGTEEGGGNTDPDP